jgi:hypothetical protein
MVIESGDVNPLEFADRLVASGDFDGCVAGASYTTADVLRAALRLIGVAPGLRTVSSAFYMVASRDWEAPSEVLTFTDCAVSHIQLHRSWLISRSPRQPTGNESSVTFRESRFSRSALPAAVSGQPWSLFTTP